jgi:hypothetical protein
LVNAFVIAVFQSGLFAMVEARLKLYLRILFESEAFDELEKSIR